MIEIGVIGLSEHSASFSKIINQDLVGSMAGRCKVTYYYHPPGNPDVEFSVERLTAYQTTMESVGVKKGRSIKYVVRRVDAVMLLTNDGRPHLEEIRPVLKAGLPVYVDKPVAENLEKVKTIFSMAKEYNCPIFSSSALRYGDQLTELLKDPRIGKVNGAETYGPAPIQPSHIDLFWDGIHGIEWLYAILGSGCKSVSRAYTEDVDVVTGIWNDGRIGVFRGIRLGKIRFGGRIYGQNSIQSIPPFEDYTPLVKEIVGFFERGSSPVEDRETIEIYAFMQAAEESKQRGGQPILLSKYIDT
ncbi:Gfo/Idh/MocA family protein [Membranihabitans marinus]|uniref:Gfo/Idh/MocA family protein n=1 Tax=Membranihabitans marinus TaxID=1227546 RepID=UPI001EFF91ED|nr:Gfo/Idh/MocA family oxidoreductase [Membranihabitans marinus]